MRFVDWALILSGGLILAGIAYPQFAIARPGWKVGSWAGGSLWSIWYGLGSLAYLAGKGNSFGWIALLAALPLAFILGFGLTTVVGRHVQLLALAGPILANLWFLQR